MALLMDVGDVARKDWRQKASVYNQLVHPDCASLCLFYMQLVPPAPGQTIALGTLENFQRRADPVDPDAHHPEPMSTITEGISGIDMTLLQPKNTVCCMMGLSILFRQSRRLIKKDVSVGGIVAFDKNFYGHGVRLFDNVPKQAPDPGMSGIPIGKPTFMQDQG